MSQWLVFLELLVIQHSKKISFVSQNFIGFRRDIFNLMKDGLNLQQSKHHQDIKPEMIARNLEFELTKKEIKENGKFRRRIDLIVDQNNRKEILENTQEGFSTEVNSNQQLDTLQEIDQFHQNNQIPMQASPPTSPQPATDIDRQFRIRPTSVFQSTTSAPKLQGQSVPSPQFNAQPQRQRPITTTLSPSFTSPSPVFTTSSNVNQNAQTPNQQQISNPQQAIRPQNNPLPTSTVNPNQPTTSASTIFTTTTSRAQTTARTCKQTCDQVVTGRNLKYQRALNIVQNEEYLSATDSGILRRNEYGQNEYENILEHPSFYYNGSQIKNILSRKKRAINPVILNYLEAGTVNGYCNDYYTKGSVLFFSDLAVVIQNICSVICCGEYFPNPAEVACCYCNYECIAAASTIYLSTNGACVNYFTSIGHIVFPAFCQNPFDICPSGTSTTTTTTIATTASACVNCTQQAIQVGSTAAGVGAIVAGGAIIAMPPIQPLVTAQGIPQGVPQPGTPFGGAPPVPTSAGSVAALALVPLGLIPVAVFPPFARYVKDIVYNGMIVIFDFKSIPLYISNNLFSLLAWELVVFVEIRGYFL